jgi:hypothetical protein
VSFHPRALVVTGAGIGLLWYAVDHQVGLVAIAVDLLLTGGVWAVLPERWSSGPSPVSDR